MKLAYLVSLYPAQSHTFIQREIEGLRALGLNIVTFSVRRPPAWQILGGPAEEEARRTRWLVPPQPLHFLAAIFWAFFTRPRLAAAIMCEAVLKRGLSARDRLNWCFYFAEAVLLAHYLRREGAGHLHCHFGNAGSNAAYLASKLARVPLSITFHGIDLDEPVPFRHADKVAHAAFVVCISHFGKKTLQKCCPPEHWTKIHVIHCGYTAPPEEALTPLPAEPHIVCVARLSEEKGHRVLLGALSVLRERAIPFHCTLAGDGPMRQELDARVQEMHLQDVVTFAGALPPTRVAALLQTARTGVLASYGEGIPVVIMETFGYARPMVATRVGGVPELVRDGENGFLVSAASPVPLADALAKILQDHALAAAMGQAGRRKVLAEFRLDDQARQLSILFKQELLL